MTTIRDQITKILAPHSTTDCQDDCQVCAGGRELTDLILATVADWLTEPGHDVRLGLALAAATPDRFPHGDGAERDAALAVAAEIATVLRPAPPERPALADRYAALAGGTR